MIFLLLRFLLVKAIDAENILESNITEALKNAYYSGRDFDDLGNYEMCNKEPDMKYALISIEYDIVHAYIGLCIPEIKSRDNIQDALISVSNNLNPEKSLEKENIQIYFSEEYSESPLSISAMITVIIISILIIISIIGTLIDYKLLNLSQANLINCILLIDILKEFSIRKNMKKLIEIPEKNDNLTFINGLRVFALFYIIIYHTFNISPLSAIGNPIEVREMFQD